MRKNPKPHDLESLEHIHYEWEKVTQSLVSLIDSMKRVGSPELLLDYHTAVMRALQDLPKFVAHGHAELRELLKKRGHYSARGRMKAEKESNGSGRSKTASGKKKKSAGGEEDG